MTFAAEAAHVVEVPNVPNSIEVWQAFRDAWSSSVVFGKTDPATSLTEQPRRSTSSWRSKDTTMTTTATPAARPATAHSPRSRPRRTVRLTGPCWDASRSGCCSARPTHCSSRCSSPTPWGWQLDLVPSVLLRRTGGEVARPWVGLDNYTRVFSDPTFRASMLHAVEFLVINVPLTVFGALIAGQRP